MQMIGRKGHPVSRLEYAVLLVQGDRTEHALGALRAFLSRPGMFPSWLDERNPNCVSYDMRISSRSRYLPNVQLPYDRARNFHRIPELAEHFVYFNDDIVRAAPLAKTTCSNEASSHATPALNALRDRHNKF